MLYKLSLRKNFQFLLIFSGEFEDTFALEAGKDVH